MSNDPYERLTVAEAVRHVRVAEKNINAILEELHKVTGLHIEIDTLQKDFGAAVIILRAVAR